MSFVEKSVSVAVITVTWGDESWEDYFGGAHSDGSLGQAVDVPPFQLPWLRKNTGRDWRLVGAIADGFGRIVRLT